MADPFACFGDENEDEDGGDGEDEGSSEQGAVVETARRLVEATNARLALGVDGGAGGSKVQADDVAPVGAPAAEGSGSGEGNKDAEVEVAEEGSAAQVRVRLWPNRPPLHLGPMAAVVNPSEIGGGRGYVATQDLEPGTLLLVEEPALTWPEEQIGKHLGLVSVLSILRSDGASNIVRDMELLHPTKEAFDRMCEMSKEAVGSASSCDGGTSQSLSDYEQIGAMAEEMRAKHGGDPLLSEILDEASRKNVTATGSSDGESLRPDDVYRLLLALRYNGFSSGLYLHCSLFNHDCDPNCIKYLPEGDDRQRPYSEVRTTKHVRRGEALTLTYLDPREVSHATRRWHLYDQHRFDIGAQVENEHLRQLELVDGALPASSVTERGTNTPTFNVEQVLTDFEGQLRNVKVGVASGRDNGQCGGDSLREQSLERAKALELAALELCTASGEKLGNPNHLLLVRCWRLHLDAAEVLLGGSGGDFGLTSAQRSGLMCRFVKTARSLLDLQLVYLGRHHPDVARTYQDLAQGIRSLLSRSPKKLYALGLDGMTTFAQCSREEDRCRREHERISALYPRDAERVVASVRVSKQQQI